MPGLRPHLPPFTMGIADQASTTSQVIFGAVFYSICSSSMLIVNKFAVRLFPMPSSVATIQLAFCMVVVFAIKYGKLAVVDDIVMEKAKPYMVYTVLFALSIYANIQVRAWLGRVAPDRALVHAPRRADAHSASTPSVRHPDAHPPGPHPPTEALLHACMRMLTPAPPPPLVFPP